MALDFTGIRDERGAAIYFLHDDTPIGEHAFKKLMAGVKEQCENQCVMMSIKDQAARKIVDFYDLKGTQIVIIVRDDDQLHHVWSDGERFDADRIAYSARRAG